MPRELYTGIWRDTLRKVKVDRPGLFRPWGDRVIVEDVNGFFDAAVLAAQQLGYCAGTDYIQVWIRPDPSGDFDSWDPVAQPFGSDVAYLVEYPFGLKAPCTPAIDPLPTPAPTPTPAPVPGACPAPVPGPLAKWEVKVHVRGPNWTTLDSTPLVGPNADFCRAIGYTDGRRFCPPRTEGTPEAEVRACNARVVGPEGQFPAWSWNGQAVGAGGPVGVAHDDNPYHLLVRPQLHGIAEVCGVIVCGDLTL